MTQSSSDPDTSTAAAAQGEGRSEADHAPLEQLGQLLRQAREARGLSREALAGQLNMGLEQLQALETADHSRLPETVFIVAQARRVASQLQVDIDAPIQALRRAMPAGSRPSGAAQSTAAKSPGAKGTAAEAGPRAAVALPLAGPPKAAAAAARPAAGAGTGSSSTAPAGASPLAAFGRALAWLALLGGLGAAARLGWNHWQQAQGPARPSTGAPPAPAEPTTPPPTAATPAPAAPAPAAADQLVLIAASEPSWLEVQTRDGEILFRGSLEGRRSFPLGNGLRVLAGRPDLVQVQRGGGAPEAMGAIEDVRPRLYEAGSSATGTATNAAPPVTPPAR